MTASKVERQNDVLDQDKNHLPKGWIFQSIDCLSKHITKGSTPTTYGFSYLTQGIRFIKVENLDKNHIVHTLLGKYISKEAHEYLKRSQLKENDILFSIAGTIGKTAIVQKTDLPANTNQAIAIIRCSWQFIEPLFLIAVLNSPNLFNLFKRKKRGGAMSNVSLEDVKQTIIPLPPLNEQKRIVTKIESIFAQIDAAKERLEELASQTKSPSSSLNMLRNSVLKNIFEDTNYSIKNLNEQIEDSEKFNPQINPENIFKYVEISSVGSNKQINDFKKILGKNAPSRARNIIRKNDVIYGTTRPYYRNVVLIPEYFDNEVCSTGFCVLRSKNSRLEPTYLFYYMLSDGANDQIIPLMRGGNYPAVSNKHVTSIKIPLPSLAEQKRIVTKIESIFAGIDAIKTIICIRLIQNVQL